MKKIIPGPGFSRQMCSVGLTLLLTALLGGCNSVFTEVVPAEGATCDRIEVRRDPDHRSNCGINTVKFDDRPASGVCLEGTGGTCGSGTDLVFFIPASWPAGSGTLSVEQSIAGTGCALLGARGSGVYTFPFTVTEQLRSPAITSFTADDTEIDAGDATVLRWTVSGTTTRIRLDSIPVAATGTLRVSPSSTTTYHLVAENSCLRSADTVTVCVNTPQPTPRITAIDSTRPGLAFRVNGSNLAFTGCAGDLESSLVFTQDGRILPRVVDASPAAGSLDGTLPTALMPGDATVVARVGTLESAPFAFTVGGCLGEGSACRTIPPACSTRPSFDVPGITECRGSTPVCVAREGTDYCTICGGICGACRGQSCSTTADCAPPDVCAGPGEPMPGTCREAFASERPRPCTPITAPVPCYLPSELGRVELGCREFYE